MKKKKDLISPELLNELCSAKKPSLDVLEYFLSLGAGPAQKLFTLADQVRRQYAGQGILLRGIVEFSNYCRNTCAYCGLNKNNKGLERYRLSAEQILQAIDLIWQCKIKTVVLQSGEEDELDAAWLSEIIKAIKQKYDMSITLSVGERSKDDYKRWKAAGADRYLLKIETSDEQLYEKMHKGMKFSNRIKCLKTLQELGYQTGSGIIIGLKGQTYQSIAKDILFFQDWDFDMIGIGPFLPHQATLLAKEKPGDVLLTLKALALTRIITKNSHLPATTALGSRGKDHRLEALQGGANVLMPNFTPQPYRQLYEIYPNKRCVTEQPGLCINCQEDMAKKIGRTIDYSKGDSLKSLRQ